MSTRRSLLLRVLLLSALVAGCASEDPAEADRGGGAAGILEKDACELLDDDVLTRYLGDGQVVTAPGEHVRDGDTESKMCVIAGVGRLLPRQVASISVVVTAMPTPDSAVAELRRQHGDDRPVSLGDRAFYSYDALARSPKIGVAEGRLLLGLTYEVSEDVRVLSEEEGLASVKDLAGHVLGQAR